MSAKRMEDIHHASGIYAFFNTTNGKCYVGSALNLYSRLRHHLGHLRKGDHKNKHFQSSWLKYGETSFVWVVLEYVPDKMQLLGREQAWIDSLYSDYNKSRIAGGCHGVVPSKEKREKIGTALKKKYAEDADFRESQAKMLSHISNTPEERARRSRYRKERWKDPEYRAKIIAASKGKKRSEEARAKMREAQRRRFANNPEQLEALRAQAKKAIEARWSKQKGEMT